MNERQIMVEILRLRAKLRVKQEAMRREVALGPKDDSEEED